MCPRIEEQHEALNIAAGAVAMVAIAIKSATPFQNGYPSSSLRGGDNIGLLQRDLYIKRGIMGPRG